MQGSAGMLGDEISIFVTRINDPGVTLSMFQFPFSGAGPPGPTPQMAHEEAHSQVCCGLYRQS